VTKPGTNVDALMRALAVVQRDGFLAGIDFIADEIAAPDIEFSSLLASSVEGRSVFKGRDEVRDYWVEFLNHFDFAVKRAEVSTEADGDLIVASGRIVGEARGSGMPLDQQVASLFEFEGGKLIRASSYLSRDEAVAAATEMANA
jgi:ketosteroid isomerase-like protein